MLRVYTAFPLSTKRGELQSALPSITTENAVRVGAADMNGDGIKDLIMTKGDSYRPILFAYEDDPLGVLKQVVMYPEPKTEGLWVAGSK